MAMGEREGEREKEREREREREREKEREFIRTGIPPVLAGTGYGIRGTGPSVSVIRYGLSGTVSRIGGFVFQRFSSRH
jgi:hypothetical protein